MRNKFFKRFWLFALVAVVVAVVAAACGGGEEKPAATATPKATPAAASPRATPAASPRPASPAASPGAAAPVSGPIDVEQGDNFFTFQGKKQPNIAVKAGQEVTINIANKGQAIHNMRIAGLDDKYDSKDDFVSNPDVMKPGDKATLKFKLEKAGTFKFRCDFHPDEMTGTITVQ